MVDIKHTPIKHSLLTTSLVVLILLISIFAPLVAKASDSVEGSKYVPVHTGIVYFSQYYSSGNQNPLKAGFSSDESSNNSSNDNEISNSYFSSLTNALQYINHLFSSDERLSSQTHVLPLNNNSTHATGFVVNPRWINWDQDKAKELSYSHSMYAQNLRDQYNLSAQDILFSEYDAVAAYHMPNDWSVDGNFSQQLNNNSSDIYVISLRKHF